jgi:hypothetical protein
MDWSTTIADVVAALASLAVIAFAISQRKDARPRRLTEVADLVDEIRAGAEWGSTASVKREEAQRKLQTRFDGLDLATVRELAHATLRSDEDSFVIAVCRRSCQRRTWPLIPAAASASRNRAVHQTSSIIEPRVGWQNTSSSSPLNAVRGATTTEPHRRQFAACDPPPDALLRQL